ncbi:MAG: hypothetical protein NUV97_00340 [archaeon]|nr:hypothetical protein [archaeon]MCR4323999.1 hypothetical protein [Nanoarchaeota archaeon]
MAKKKRTKKNVVVKEEVVNEILPKKVEEKENRQLIWFFAIIIIIFLSFMGPYWYIQSSKSFTYGGVDWFVEEYANLEVFHGRFAALDGNQVNYNVYLRNDPRENNVYTEGKFSKFNLRNGGYVSFSPEVDSCRGEVARIMTDLGSFLKAGVGMKIIDSATNDINISKSTGTTYADCSVTNGKTVVVVQIGEPSVVQPVEGKDCYVITVKNCEDGLPVEKFMIKAIADVQEKTF